VRGDDNDGFTAGQIKPYLAANAVSTCDVRRRQCELTVPVKPYDYRTQTTEEYEAVLLSRY